MKSFSFATGFLLFATTCFAQHPQVQLPQKYKISNEIISSLLWKSDAASATSGSFNMIFVGTEKPVQFAWWQQVPNLKLNYSVQNAPLTTTTPTVYTAISLMANEGLVRFYRNVPYNENNRNTWNRMFDAIDPRLRK